MAINMKKITSRAQEELEKKRNALNAGKGPRVTQEEARQALQKQREVKESQEPDTTKRAAQSPFRTREEALQALKKQKEQKQTKTTATPAVASAVKPAAATVGVKPTLTAAGPVTETDAKAVTDWYTQNSEKAKEARWVQSRKDYTSAEGDLKRWQAQDEKLRAAEDAWAAYDAGQQLTYEQQKARDEWDYEGGREELAQLRKETDAGIASAQSVMDSNRDSFVNGYNSIKNERAERYKGTQSDVEANAAQMIQNGQMGEWSQMWQQSMDEKTAQRDAMAKDLEVLKSSGADKAVISEVEERLGWLEEDVQSLTDVSILANSDYATYAGYDETNADPVYKYVNGVAPEQTWSSEANAQNQNMYDLLSQTDATERNIYNYLYAKHGRKEANRYLDGLKNRLQYRQSVKVEAESQQLAEEHPVAATAMSVMMSPLQAAGAVNTGVAALTGNQANPYAAAFAPVRMRETAMGTVQENIESPLGKGLYQVGTSIADNLVNMGVGGGFGKAASTIAGGLMGLEAASGKAMQMMEAGADTKTAALGGGLAGGAEMLTEKMGFDKLFGKFISGKLTGSYKDLLKAGMTSFFAGGAEETTSAFFEDNVERWLMGENSQRVQLIREGVESGKSVDESIRDADWQFIRSLGETFAVGGVAEGLMGGGSYALGVSNARNAAKEIKAELPGVNEELVQQAMEMEAGVRAMDENVVAEAYAEIEAEQEKQAEKQNHAVFDAPAVAQGVQGVVSGVQKSGEGAEVLVRQDGKETAVPLSEVQFQSEEQRQAYGYATAYADESTARQFLAGYEKSNAPIRNYAKGFAAVYAAGRNSRQLIGTEKVWAKAVPEMVQQLAYEAGQKAAAQEDARLEMDADVDAAIARNVQAIPRMVTEEYTGAVNQVRRSRITKSQATQMALLDWLGKKFGTQYIFVDSFRETQAANQHLGAAAASVQNGMINGVYKAGTNQMVIALDAEGGNLLRAAGHESWHYIKEHSQKNDYVRGDAEALQAFVLDKLQGVEGYDLETRIAQKQDQYKRMAGQELDRDAAVEEIVADSLVEVLATEQNVRDLMEQHATLGEKVLGFVKRFLGEIRATLRKLGGKNAEARAMLEQDEKTLQQIADHFDRVMIEVNAVRESEGAATESDGGVKLSLHEMEDGTPYVSVDTDQDIFDNVPLNEYKKVAEKYLLQHFRGTVVGTKNRAYVDRRATREYVHPAKHNIEPSIYEGKMRAAPELGNMLDAGQFLGHIENDGIHPEAVGGWDKYKVVFEVSGRFFEGEISVMLIANNRRRFHDITKIKDITAAMQGRNAPRHGNISANSIADETKNGKNKFSLSDEVAPQTNTAAFKRWFGDSVVVNEDGSPKVMYHGTPYGDFTVFKEWQYFTDDKSYADRYHNPGASSIRGRYPEATHEKTYAVYLSVKKPFDTRLPEVRKIWENEFFGSYSRTPLSEKGLPDWTDGIDLVDFIEENEYDFDGIILDEGATGGYGDEVQSRGVSVVVRGSSQIKSATDNVGSFDAGNSDIRYSLAGEDTEVEHIKGQIRAKMDMINQMEPVANITAPNMVKESKTNRIRWAIEMLKPYGEKIERQGFGEIKIGRNQIDMSVQYLKTPGDIAAVLAVPRVLKRGVEIARHTEHKGRPFDTVTFAAPVVINGVRGNVGVVVKLLDRNLYKTHRIIMPDGSAFVFEDNEKSREDTRGRHSSQERGASTRNNSANNSIADEMGDGKNKFSLRDVDTTNTTMETLLEENRALRDTVRALNQQLKGEAGTLDEKAVRRVASGLKKKYASTVPLNTLTENLMRAFNAMQSAENTRQSEAAMEMMGNIALDMIQKSQTADREAYDNSRELRERFRKNRIGLTDTQWQEAESLYDTARDFRRAVFGKWNVPAQNGRGVTTLDMIWDDLAGEYPQYFDAEASEGDMVQQVLAMLDATSIKYENPFGVEIEQVASGVAAEIYREYLGAGSETGGKNAAVDKLMDQLADARKTILEQKRGLRKANRDIADMRAKREAQALRRKQNQDYTQVKNEIIRKKGQLLKKLEAPKSGAFIPQSMHDAVHELLKAIDFEGKLGGETNKPLTREMLDRARDEYAKLNLPDENGGTGPMAAFYNGDLVHDFNLLSVEADGLRAKELSMKHMQSLRNIVAGYAAAIINEDRMFMQSRRESLQETGDDLLASMSTRREHTVQGPLKKWLSDGLQQGLLKPVTAFHQFKGTAMEPVWKALRNAEGQHIRHVEEATAYLEEALGKYDQHKSIREEGTKGKRDKAQEITFDNGTKMQLTDQELMTLYATAKREQMVGTQHLVKGGFTLANAPKGSSLRPVILTAKDIQTINSSLTQQQREYVDHMVGYLSGTCADWGNEVTMELYGVEKFHEEYYIPFSVNKNYVKVEPATEQDSRIKTGSFTKALTANASNPLEIKPFTEIWCQHVEKMSDYNAFVLPIEDMTRLMNYKGEGDGVKATMNRAYGKQTTEYIMHFLRRLNGNSRNEMGESWLGGFMGRAKGAAVTFNLSVAIQQAGSAPRAMAMIDPRHFMSGFAKAIAHGKVDGKHSIHAAYAELEKYAPIAVEKGWGYFDTNMSRGMYQRAQDTTMNRLNDLGGKAAEWGDKITWAVIWEAVKNETADTYKEVMVGSEEYYQLCADRFQDVIDHTQVLDSIFQRAEFAAEKGGMKNFMAFMSEPLTTYNMLYRAVYDVGQAKDKTAKARAMGNLGRTFGAFAVSSALTAALKSFVMALRDRDNEKKDAEGNIIGVRDYWDKYLDSLPGAVVDNLLGAGTIFTNAISDAMSSFSGGDLTTGWIGNLYGGGKLMVDILTGNKDSTLENWEKAMYKMLQGSSSAIGVGFGNLWRDVKSIGLTAYEIVEQDMLAGAAWDQNRTFEERLKAAQKNYVYKKQPGDLMHKQNTGIYYDLMLTAYFEDGGMYENCEAAADAAIATGAEYVSLTTQFKKKLAVAEELIPEAAEALVNGDMDTYRENVEILQEKGIGLRPISSMILSEVKSLMPEEKEERGRGSGASVVMEMQREDVDEDPEIYLYERAYEEAKTPSELKAAIDKMRNAGETQDDLKKMVRGDYKEMYCEAIWNGDTKTAKDAAAMMKGAGVGITDADLKDWTGGDTARSTLYKTIRAGDGKKAVKIRAVMYKTSGQKEVNKYVENWIKNNLRGSKDEEAGKKALLALGYSQQTIDGWFKK